MKLKTSEIIILILIGSDLNPTIYIIDFSDSFTYNIFSELKIIDSRLNIEIISATNVESFLQHISQTNKKCGLILGPGPGSPEEYSHVFSELSDIINNSNIFLMGICLGHQLIWKHYNLIVSYANQAVHGQAVRYTLPKNLALEIGCSREISVQRYNSLAVKENKDLQATFENTNFFTHDGELIISSSSRLLTYQFHPESIGTTCPKYFFMRLVNFLI